MHTCCEGSASAHSIVLLTAGIGKVSCSSQRPELGTEPAARGEFVGGWEQCPTPEQHFPGFVGKWVVVPATSLTVSGGAPWPMMGVLKAWHFFRLCFLLWGSRFPLRFNVLCSLPLDR